MSIRSERPVSPEQIHAALSALAAEPEPDQKKRPEGSQEEHRLHLLGRLLAKTELEITAATRLIEEEEIEDVLETLLGWWEQLGANPDLALNVLTNRLQRTAVQVSEPEAEELPPGREAAFAAVMTAVYALGAQLHADRGDEEGTRHALSGAEEALIDILQGMHELRVAMGDAAGPMGEGDG
ncbi:hypothetical protein GCM10010300_76180 [Streptomyces olivaceoviridis]|uniref:hypothetical protein n=1 Tax=Streptomyces olivaceoviridis TaxID=1921 RepID=UPI001675EDBE|nr:hypothetical protein [Streptomyces olivaceoviridis]GGZ21113.1 hypothetical protein GCM10010300_76180 [Streptomyces olivaceoviridis]